MGYARLFDAQTAARGRMPWFARAARPPGCPKRSGFESRLRAIDLLDRFEEGEQGIFN